jgi:hypothetical protein
LSKTLSTRFFNPSSLSPLPYLAAMIPTEVSELIRTNKFVLIGLDAMCGARLRELQTSHDSISLQNTFKQHLWASHWTTCSYIEPCCIVSGGHHMIYTAKQIVRPQLIIWCKWVKMDLREIGWDDVGWIDVAQDRDQCRGLVNMVLNLRVS